jgi:hypothetical protein
MATILVTDRTERIVVRIDEQPDDDLGIVYWSYCRACRTVTTDDPFDTQAEAIADAVIHVNRNNDLPAHAERLNR